VSDAYLADLTVNHGNSGGPVFSVDNGKIIGVCVSFLVANTEVLLRNGKSRPVYTNENQPLIYNSRIANIIPVKYVIELLKKNGVEYLGQ
jgi:S1-C subfamily serine protease